MVKKKKTGKAAGQVFNPNPFGSLKGFSASAEDKSPVMPEKPAKPVAVYGSFKEEMALLGVNLWIKIKNMIQIPWPLKMM